MPWEIVVIDNNSKDRTKAVVEEFASAHPGLEVAYAMEEKQGLSHARNRGIQLAGGEFILFTDDDVTPAPDWVVKVVEFLMQSDCLGCGGWIEPAWEEPPPSWLSERFYGFLALKPDPEGPKRVSGIEDLPFGANMGFRREAFQRYGMFATDRGRTGTKLWGCEDTEFFQRLIDGGEKVMYLPSAKVRHWIDANRLQKKYFLKWRLQASYNVAMTREFEGERRVFGVPLYLVRQTANAAFAALVAKIGGDEEEALHKAMTLMHFAGVVWGLNEKWRGGSRSDRGTDG